MLYIKRQWRKKERKQETTIDLLREEKPRGGKATMALMFLPSLADIMLGVALAAAAAYSAGQAIKPNSGAFVGTGLTWGGSGRRPKSGSSSDSEDSDGGRNNLDPGDPPESSSSSGRESSDGGRKKERKKARRK